MSITLIEFKKYNDLIQEFKNAAIFCVLSIPKVKRPLWGKISQEKFPDYSVMKIFLKIFV